jgi:hypothetical protein
LKALKGIAPFLNEFHHLKKIIVPVELPTDNLEEDHYNKLLPLDVLTQAGHPLPASLCVETDRAIRDKYWVGLLLPLPANLLTRDF